MRASRTSWFWLASTVRLQCAKQLRCTTTDAHIGLGDAVPWGKPSGGALFTATLVDFVQNTPARSKIPRRSEPEARHLHPMPLCSRIHTTAPNLLFSGFTTAEYATTSRAAPMYHAMHLLASSATRNGPWRNAKAFVVRTLIKTLRRSANYLWSPRYRGRMGRIKHRKFPLLGVSVYNVSGTISVFASRGACDT